MNFFPQLYQNNHFLGIKHTLQMLLVLPFFVRLTCVTFWEKESRLEETQRGLSAKMPQKVHKKSRKTPPCNEVCLALLSPSSSFEVWNFQGWMWCAPDGWSNLFMFPYEAANHVWIKNYHIGTNTIAVRGTTAATQSSRFILRKPPSLSESQFPL